MEQKAIFTDRLSGKAFANHVGPMTVKKNDEGRCFFVVKNPQSELRIGYISDKAASILTEAIAEGKTLYEAICLLEFANVHTVDETTGEVTIVPTLMPQPFYNCTSLQSITIPEGVTENGSSAFKDCTSLKSVNIPEGVTAIGESAFEGCTSLESINIPEGVTAIGESAFEGCTSLESVIIPNGVTKIEDYIFSGCTSLKSVNIPEGVTKIGWRAFMDCTSLKSVTIPESVTKIDCFAFKGCTSLESITIPDSVTKIGGSAFYGCTSLQSITIPNSVTEIEQDALFYNCTSLQSITIPEGVTAIGESAFEGCTSLESVIIPNCVTEIEDRAFFGCTSLKSVNIPEGVTEIGCSAFEGCTSLKSVTANGVKRIDHFAFAGCTAITDVQLSKELTWSKAKKHFPDSPWGLDKQIKDLKSKEKYTRVDSVDWDRIRDISQEETAVNISIFQRYSFSDFITLAFLKKERIRKEKERIKKLTQEIDVAICNAYAYVEQEKFEQANELYAYINNNIKEVQNKNTIADFKRLTKDLSELREKIRKAEENRRLAELKRLEEERKRCEEAERKRLAEEAERKRLAEERRQREEAERRQREAERLAEARRKEEAEMAEKRRLENINSVRKADADAIISYLQENGVSYFYHFTDKRNLQSIKRRGGLLSWYYSKQNDITIPNPGGDDSSRILDTRHNLQDFVRLSFCNDHPMAYRLHQEGADLVLLRISIDVATFEKTLFSDMNATDNSHSKGASLEDLHAVDIRATQRNYVSRSDDDFGPHQAEVMVKTFIPIKYILNIDNPTTMNFS